MDASPTTPARLLRLPNSDTNLMNPVHKMPARLRARLYKSTRQVSRASIGEIGNIEGSPEGIVRNTSRASNNDDGWPTNPALWITTEAQRFADVDFDFQLDPSVKSNGDPNVRNASTHWKCQQHVVDDTLINKTGFNYPATKTRAPVFDLSKLCLELQYYLLRFLLVVPGGITDPWITHDFTTTNNEEKVDSWKNYLRPNILATCKAIHNIGTAMLYETNEFHFTRASSHEIENTPDDMTRFLSYRHDLRGPLDIQGTTIVRGQLIRKVTIHHENDANSDQGVQESPHVGHAWQFSTLRNLEFLGCNLTSLNITMDENSPFLLGHLKFQTNMRAISTAGGRNTLFPVEEIWHRMRAWQAFQEENFEPITDEPWSLDETWALTPSGFWIESERGLFVRTLYINGMSPNGAGAHKCNTSVRSLASGPHALQVIQWLKNCGIWYIDVEFAGIALGNSTNTMPLPTKTSTLIRRWLWLSNVSFNTDLPHCSHSPHNETTDQCESIETSRTTWRECPGFRDDKCS